MWGRLRTHHSLRLIFRVTMYDYQAMCKPSSHHHSAAQPLVSVSVTKPFPLPASQSSALSWNEATGPCSHPPWVSGPRALP